MVLGLLFLIFNRSIATFYMYWGQMMGFNTDHPWWMLNTDIWWQLLVRRIFVCAIGGLFFFGAGYDILTHILVALGKP